MEHIIEIPDKVLVEITRILKHGNVAELKRVQGKLVVVELQRKVKSETRMQLGVR